MQRHLTTKTTKKLKRNPPFGKVALGGGAEAQKTFCQNGNSCLTLNLLVMSDSKDFVANGTGCSAEFFNPLYFSESAFWAKLRRFAKKAGAKVVYYALLLYYAFVSPKTQGWAKTVIIAALAYFICPIDINPDFVPVVGFLDDLAILATTLKIVDICITSDVKARAKTKLGDWFDYVNESEFA